MKKNLKKEFFKTLILRLYTFKVIILSCGLGLIAVIMPSTEKKMYRMFEANYRKLEQFTKKLNKNK